MSMSNSSRHTNLTLDCRCLLSSDLDNSGVYCASLGTSKSVYVCCLHFHRYLSSRALASLENFARNSQARSQETALLGTWPGIYGGLWRSFCFILPARPAWETKRVFQSFSLKKSRDRSPLEESRTNYLLVWQGCVMCR